MIFYVAIFVIFLVLGFVFARLRGPSGKQEMTPEQNKKQREAKLREWEELEEMDWELDDLDDR